MNCIKCESICESISSDSFICLVCGEVYEQSVFDLDIGNEIDKKRKRTCKGDRKKMGMNNIQVTELNIYSIPLDWIFVRYTKLKKWVRKQNNSDFIREIEIIEKYFRDNGKGQIVDSLTPSEIDQLETSIPAALRNQFVPIVENRLVEYYQMMRRCEWLRSEIQRREQATIQYNPKITSTLTETGIGGKGGFHSSTETAVLRPIEALDNLKAELYELKEHMYPMEKALRELTEEQLHFVQVRYFVREVPSNEQTMQTLIWSRGKYYEVKWRVMFKIADQLKVI